MKEKIEQFLEYLLAFMLTVYIGVFALMIIGG